MVAIAKYWPAIINDGVAKAQNYHYSTGTPYTCTLDGYYSEELSSGTIIDFATIGGFVRNIKVAIVGQIALYTQLTITGTQNGITVTETKSIPSEVSYSGESVQSYNTISSIILSSTLPLGSECTGNITIGTGSIGFFPAIDIADNVNATSHAFAMAFVPFPDMECTYTLYEALGDIENFTYQQLITNGTFIPPKGSVPYTATQLMQFTDICSYMLVQVASSAEASTLRMQFLSLE